MKRFFAMLFSLALLLSLAACGGNDDAAGGGDSLTLVNRLDRDLEQIHIVAAGAEDWGEAAVGILNAGVGAYLYPRELLGSARLAVDIRAVDEFNNFYEFYDVTIGVGDALALSRQGALAILEINGDTCEGGFFPGDPYADLYNQLDARVLELYVAPTGTQGWGEAYAWELEDGDSAILQVQEEFGEPKLLADLVLVDEYQDQYTFTQVLLRDGSEYTFYLDDYGTPMLRNDTFGGSYAAQHLGGGSDHILEDILGLWQDSWMEEYLLLYEDLTWDLIDFDGERLDTGDYEFLGREVILTGEVTELSLRWNDLGDLQDEEDTYQFTFRGDFESGEFADFLQWLGTTVAWFPQNGYEVNYDFGEGGYYMENATLVTMNAGQFYGRMYATISLELDSLKATGDGYVEIEFTSTVYLDPEDYPDFYYEQLGTCSVGNRSGLYDYYTGFALPASKVYGNSSKGDNSYHYEYESQGRTICVDYSYSTDWTANLDNSAYLVTQVFVRMPADYDGLIYGIPEAWPDFVTFAVESNSESQEIAPMEVPENTLFCRIHTPE